MARKRKRTLKHPAGSWVLYRAGLGHTIKALVKKNPGNGRLKVEAFFEQREGQDYGGFLGYVYDIRTSDLVQPTQEG